MWEGEGSLSFAAIIDFQFLFLSVLFPNSPGKGFAFVEGSFLHFLFKMLHVLRWVAAWVRGAGQALWILVCCQNAWQSGGQIRRVIKELLPCSLICLLFV